MLYSDSLTWVLLLPSSFQGIQVPLSGVKTVTVHANKGGANSERDQQIYNVRASAHGTSELYLLTSDKNSSERVGCAPTFSGLLTVCESYGYKANRPLQVIPAAPPPSIPSELKHRFPLLTQMASTQTCVAKDETDGLDKRLIEETEEEDGRKKKKRKRERKIKQEPEEETDILRVNENVAEIQDQVKTEMPFQEAGSLEEKKRRRKKKKENSEQDDVEEFKVKTEPVDSWSNDVAQDSNKKKKKKKKSKLDAD